MSLKKNNPGCDCCGCDPPTCTLTGTGGGSVGGNVNLTWTTTDATTVTIYDEDSTLISTATSGTSVLVSGGACKTYTLTATNACGVAVCEYTNSCPDPGCSSCLLDSAPSTFTVIFTNNGLLSNCGCTDETANSRCAQFDGSFTVTLSATNCEWSGGTFGSAVFCVINRGVWTIKLIVQVGDCDGNNTDKLYAVVRVSYTVVDPPVCQDIAQFQKQVNTTTARVDCADVIPGIYTACGLPFGVSSTMCDIDCEVA